MPTKIKIEKLYYTINTIPKVSPLHVISDIENIHAHFHTHPFKIDKEQKQAEFE